MNSGSDSPAVTVHPEAFLSSVFSRVAGRMEKTWPIYGEQRAAKNQRNKARTEQLEPLRSKATESEGLCD